MWLPLMPNIRGRISRGFQQQVEHLGAALPPLFTSMAAPNFIAWGVAGVAVHRLYCHLYSSLPYLRATVGLACVSRSRQAVAASCFKTIAFVRITPL